jgi:hypothetical protein
MMASFMRFYKSIKQLFVLCLFMGMAHHAVAGSIAPNTNVNSLTIKTAEIVLEDEAYLLNADVDVKFNADLEEALNKGFEFNFLVEFQLVIPYQYWFDDEVVTVTNRVVLSYHALSRQYLIQRGDQQKSFASLDEVRQELGRIRDFKVFSKADVSKGEPYKAALLMRLDHTKLPKALLAEADSADEWKMISQRFEWIPSLFK